MTEATDKKADDKTILTHEAEITAWLSMHGFRPTDKSPFLFERVETGSGDRVYADFREHPRGWFYGWFKKDGSDIPDEAIRRMPDYIAFREAFTPSQVSGAAAPQPAASSAPGGSAPSVSKAKSKAASKANAPPAPAPPQPSLHTEKVQHALQQTGMVPLERKDEAYTLMNLRDDDQVLIEIQGGFMEEFVYSFPTKEGKVTGLSWVGVKEVARQMGNISVESCDIVPGPESYLVKCKARDVQRNVTMFGVAEQSRTMKLRSGELVPDLHAMSKAVSRAQRNAIRALIPEVYIKDMISKYLQEKSKGRAA